MNEQQARRIAGAVAATMALEQQDLTSADVERLYQRLRAGNVGPSLAEAAPGPQTSGHDLVDPDDRVHLRPERAGIATNAELNTAEADNIADAFVWAAGQPWTTAGLLQQSTLRHIHHQMFGHVWQWAGIYRRREVNIGNCSSSDIATRLEQVLGNLAYQANVGRDALALATEYHHAIGQIHPFTNGNGRHARLTTELLAGSLSLQPGAARWGVGQYGSEEARRKSYLAALHEADRGSYGALQLFIFG